MSAGFSGFNSILSAAGLEDSRHFAVSGMTHCSEDSQQEF